ncbi:kinase-like protein [Wilcoxina mikolae CBS 423.85]|nr:kinase-like protein [Wilcoxina mikolae CBS 423.85]
MLGYGGYSTIIIAAASGDGDRFLDAAFLRRLGPQPQTSEWRWLWNALPFGWGSSSGGRARPSFFPALLDEFTIHGPNGDHRCLVTEALEPSLCSLANDNEELYTLPPGVAKKIAVQLAHAVAELHGCGIVHGDPDLHPNNVLFHIRRMESWTVDDVRNHLGEPQKLTINLQNSPSPSPHLPKHLVCAPAVSNLVPLCLDSATIKITDFGVAFYCTGPEGGIRKTIGAPPSFAAPEVQLQDILTPACDVWSLDCLLYTIFSTNYLWIPAFGYHDSLLDLTFCFCKLPDPWWDGQLKPEKVGQVMVTGNDFESRLNRVPRCQDGLLGMEDEEYAWFRRLMYEIFKLDPKERMVAKEVVRYLPPVIEGVTGRPGQWTKRFWRDSGDHDRLFVVNPSNVLTTKASLVGFAGGLRQWAMKFGVYVPSDYTLPLLGHFAASQSPRPCEACSGSDSQSEPECNACSLLGSLSSLQQPNTLRRLPGRFSLLGEWFERRRRYQIFHSPPRRWLSRDRSPEDFQPKIMAIRQELDDLTWVVELGLEGASIHTILQIPLLAQRQLSCTMKRPRNS